MDGHKVRDSKIFRTIAAWAVTLVVLCGCVPITAEIEPPQVPAGMSGVVVNASPEEIALSRPDLPAGFQLAAEKSEDPDYVGLYLRPSALDPEASGGNLLLSVLTSVGVYTTTATAEAIYLEAAADPAGRNLDDLDLVSDAATDLVSEPFAGAAQGADASEAYRVTYRLQGRPVYEYGHRVRLGNVLAYVVVAAVGDPDEPPHLLEDARNLVQRQIDHIIQAASQPATE